MRTNKKFLVLGASRVLMGFIFLWAFLDKTFGLGFATTAERAWVNGGSPTTGFLLNSPHGPFMEFFNSLAGVPLVDWLFMLGMLFIGVALTLGIFMKLGSFFGALMMLFMYLALGLPPENNPFVDEHLIYAFFIAYFGLSESAEYFGFGPRWSRSPFILKHPIFK